MCVHQQITFTIRSTDSLTERKERPTGSRWIFTGQTRGQVFVLPDGFRPKQAIKSEQATLYDMDLMNLGTT